MTDADIKKQTARIEKERVRLGTFWHFYRVVLASLPDNFEPIAGCTTACTDGRRIYWHLPYIATLDTEELQFVLAHESLHCVLLHHLRGRGLDNLILNIAGDYVINLLLTKEGVGRMPKGGLLNVKYDGWSTEEVYADIAQQRAEKAAEKAAQQPEPDQGDEGADKSDAGNGAPQEGAEGDEDGSEGSDTGEGSKPASEAPGEPTGQGKAKQGSQDGAGSEGDSEGSEGSDPGGCGGVLPGAADAEEEAEQANNWQRVVRSAVSAGARQAGGRVNATGQLILGNLDAAQVRWEDELAEFISVSISKDYSWQRPDRRFDGREFMLPGLVPDAASHGVLMIDSSGSMSDAQVQRCLEEVQGIADSGAVDRITVVCIDTDVRSVETFERGDRIEMGVKGRGGTMYQPAWKWIADLDEAPDFIVYMTDLEPWEGFGDEPIVPLLWACSTYSASESRRLRERMDAVPFGRCIEVV